MAKASLTAQTSVTASKLACAIIHPSIHSPLDYFSGQQICQGQKAYQTDLGEKPSLLDSFQDPKYPSRFGSIHTTGCYRYLHETMMPFVSSS